MQRFLIIQTAFLGDVILATPIISELKRLYPSSQIDVLVRKGNESLLANNPKINQLFVWEKKIKKYQNLFKIIRQIRKVKYDEVYTLQRYMNAGLITLFSHTKLKIGFNKNALLWQYDKKISHSLLDGSHEVERNLKLIAHHEGAKKCIRPELYPSAKDIETVVKYQTEKYYCIAPASVWETKKLPLKKWKELTAILTKNGTIYLLGSAADFNLCETLKTNEKVQNLAGKLSLLQSAALMKDASMNYVNDSGPLHIASAMNAPTRAFFCSTVPAFGFGPLAEDSKIIETNMNLECRPCTFHGRKNCPLGHYNCGNSIDISEETIQ